MPHANNIVNIRINNVSGNGSVNMGSAIHKGYAANAEGVGGQTIIGDEYASSSNHNSILNFNNDPDLVDQPQAQV